MPLHILVKPGDASGRRARQHVDQIRDTVLDIAEEMFVRLGFSRTGFDEIIARAGGSKATVFKLFGNKAGLYEAVIQRATQRFLADFPDDGAEMEASFAAYARRILDFYLESASLLVFRNLLAEGINHPEAGRALHRSGHDQIIATLADRIRNWQRQGELADGDAEVLADQFVHLLRCGIYEKILLGLRRKATRKELEQHVEQTVRLFLCGVKRAGM